MVNKKNKNSSSTKRFIKIVLIILLVFLFVGIVYNYFQSKKPKSDEEKLKELKEQRLAYDNGVLKALTNEWWIYIIARSIIALFVILVNYVFYRYWNNPINYNNQISLNEALLLGYSFLAFIIAGTPTKFVELLRTTIYNWRKREHVGAINIDEVNKEIELLEELLKKQKAV